MNFYGFSAGKLKDSFWVKNEAFFNNLAEDSDICISLTTAFGGALERALLISGVIPLISLWKTQQKLGLNLNFGAKNYLHPSNCLFGLRCNRWRILESITLRPKTFQIQEYGRTLGTGSCHMSRDSNWCNKTGKWPKIRVLKVLKIGLEEIEKL